MSIRYIVSLPYVKQVIIIKVWHLGQHFFEWTLFGSLRQVSSQNFAVLRFHAATICRCLALQRIDDFFFDATD